MQDADLPFNLLGFYKPENSQFWFAHVVDPVEVPAGLFRLDLRVEGMLNAVTLPGIEGYYPATFGPAGAPGGAPGDRSVPSAGSGGVSMYFISQSGYLTAEWAPPAGRSSDAVVNGSVYVRGPGRLLVSRYYGNLEPPGGTPPRWRVAGTQTYSVSVTPVADQQTPPPELQVQCPSVTRGERGRCVASMSDNSAFTVTHWNFTSPPDPGSTEPVTVDLDADSVGWGGPLVRSGTVTVTAMVNGRERKASTPLTVINREWGTKTADYSFRRITSREYGLLTLASVVKYADDLGASTWLPLHSRAERAPQYTAYADGGPNDNIEYFKSGETLHFYGYYAVNTAVMVVSSGFYNAQISGPGRPGRYGGVNTCDARVVTDTLETLVDDHERYHGEVYKAALDAHVAPSLIRLENLTSPNSAFLYRAYNREWVALDSLAGATSLAVHKNGSVRGLTRPADRDGPCALLNENRQILTPKP
ncbi:MAG TPA: hypothetical protein VF665_25380 [Longimicrobium sp.]